MPTIGREAIMSMIPHAGEMGLLDEVLHWDAETLCAISRCSQAPGANPLRRSDGTLGTVCGIEIVAQAMAVHGRLTMPLDGEPVPGYLISLRDVHLVAATLDNADGDLYIEIRLLMSGEHAATYKFILSAQARELLSGRATVLYGAD